MTRSRAPRFVSRGWNCLLVFCVVLCFGVTTPLHDAKGNLVRNAWHSGQS